MNKLGYSNFVSKMVYYLYLYPSVEVAMECVKEDFDGTTPQISKDLNEALADIKSGMKDTEAVQKWADKTGVEELATLAEKVEEARAKGIDVGYYVRKFIPVVIPTDDIGRLRDTKKPNKRYKKNKRK